MQVVRRGCLVATGLLVLVVIAAVVYVDIRYQAVRAASRVPQAAFAPPLAVVRLQVVPDLAYSALEKRLAGLVPVARWAVPWIGPRVLPYEVGLVCDPDLNSLSTGLTLYANTRRLAPLIADLMNGSGRIDGLLGAQWEPAGLHVRGRGELILKGATPIRAEVARLTRDQWGLVSPLSPTESSGEHLFEVVLDLRDGRAFALIASLVPPSVPPSDLSHPSQLIHLVKNIATARLTGDLNSPEQMVLHLEVECRPELTESDANSTSFLLNTVTAQLGDSLNQAYGVTLEGRCDPDGMWVLGEYTLRGVDRLLDQWLPAETAEP